MYTLGYAYLLISFFMTIATVCYLKTTSTTDYNCKNFVHLNKTPIIWILTSTILIIYY